MARVGRHITCEMHLFRIEKAVLCWEMILLVGLGSLDGLIKGGNEAVNVLLGGVVSHESDTPDLTGQGTETS